MRKYCFTVKLGNKILFPEEKVKKGWLNLYIYVYTCEKLLFFMARVLCRMNTPVSFGGFQILSISLGWI